MIVIFGFVFTSYWILQNHTINFWRLGEKRAFLQSKEKLGQNLFSCKWQNKAQMSLLTHFWYKALHPHNHNTWTPATPETVTELTSSPGEGLSTSCMVSLRMRVIHAPLSRLYQRQQQTARAPMITPGVTSPESGRPLITRSNIAPIRSFSRRVSRMSGGHPWSAAILSSAGRDGDVRWPVSRRIGDLGGLGVYLTRGRSLYKYYYGDTGLSLRAIRP